MQLGSSTDPNFTGQTDFTASTTPTKTEVEEWINSSEDFVDRETMHAWRNVTVTKETHHLHQPSYQRRDGTEIFLNHRNIRTLTSGTDLLEVWDGNEFLDYLANKTEGRNNDYWVDEQLGLVFIKSHSAYLPRNFAVRISYRYGETSVTNDIKRACILLTAADILESDDRTVLLPEGTSNLGFESKAKRWRERAENIIARNREVKTISM